jgi:hypothetical protein
VAPPLAIRVKEVNVDLSAHDLPASYCTGALFLKIAKRLSFFSLFLFLKCLISIVKSECGKILIAIYERINSLSKRIAIQRNQLK